MTSTPARSSAPTTFRTCSSVKRCRIACDPSRSVESVMRTSGACGLMRSLRPGSMRPPAARRPARADVASNTRSGRSSRSSSQSTPPAEASTPRCLARSRPADAGSTPTMYRTSTCSLRCSLATRSVPMLPGPTIAVVALPMALPSFHSASNCMQFSEKSGRTEPGYPATRWPAPDPDPERRPVACGLRPSPDGAQGGVRFGECASDDRPPDDRLPDQPDPARPHAVRTGSVTASYRELFAEPRLRRLALADVCARLPQGMVTITLLLVVAQHASMTVAGLVVAGYTLDRKSVL